MTVSRSKEEEVIKRTRRQSGQTLRRIAHLLAASTLMAELPDLSVAEVGTMVMSTRDTMHGDVDLACVVRGQRMIVSMHDGVEGERG